MTTGEYVTSMWSKFQRPEMLKEGLWYWKASNSICASCWSFMIFHDLSIGSSSTASTQLTQPNATRSRDHPPSSLASTSELSWNPPPQRVVSWTNGFGCLLTNGFARISCRRKTSVWPPPRAGDSIVAPYDFLDACLRWAARPWKPLRFEASHAPATGPRRIERSTQISSNYLEKEQRKSFRLLQWLPRETSDAGCQNPVAIKITNCLLY